MIGGAVAAVSYTVNYYAKGFNKARFTTTDDIKVNTDADVDLDLEKMSKNIKDARTNLPDVEKYKIESKNIGLSNSKGYMMNDNGNFNVLARTDYHFWSGKSSILYSTKAASDLKLLGRIMSHETAHAFSYAFRTTRHGIKWRL